MQRRPFLMTSIKSAALGTLAASLTNRIAAADAALAAAAPTSRINHSACKWCYGDIPLEDLCIAGKAIGLQSIELLMPDDFTTLHKHGLTCAMVSFPVGTTAAGLKVGTIAKAFNRLEHHDALVTAYVPHLKAAAAVGAKNVICFSGNREGMDNPQGLENCAIGLQRLLPLAEQLGLKLVMDLLNSKVNHKDYMFDHIAWGVDVMQRVNSPRVKILYDIYHAQIMDGDIVRNIRDHIQWIGHFHTGGNPGRHDIDDSQELNYRFIAKAIGDVGYTGYLAHEYSPDQGHEPLATLDTAMAICDI